MHKQLILLQTSLHYLMFFLLNLLCSLTSWLIFYHSISYKYYLRFPHHNKGLITILKNNARNSIDNFIHCLFAHKLFRTYVYRRDLFPSFVKFSIFLRNHLSFSLLNVIIVYMTSLLSNCLLRFGELNFYLFNMKFVYET